MKVVYARQNAKKGCQKSDTPKNEAIFSNIAGFVLSLPIMIIMAALLILSLPFIFGTAAYYKITEKIREGL